MRSTGRTGREHSHSAVRRVRDRLVLAGLEEAVALVAVGLTVGGSKRACGEARKDEDSAGRVHCVSVER